MSWNVDSIILPRNFSMARLNILLWVILFGGLIYNYIPIIRSIPSLGHFMIPAGYLAFGMFYVLWKKKFLSSWQKYVLAFIVIPLEIFIRIATGALYQVMYLMLFFVVIKYFYTNKMPIVLASVMCIFYLFFNPVKMEYRYITMMAEENNEFNSFLNNSTLFLSLAYENISNVKDSTDYFISQEESLARISHIFEFAAVVKDTPERIPFWEGETYKPLLTMFIPRIIWPNKPEEHVGQSYGHRYGFLYPSDDVTSWNLPWIIEMFANFGFAGVVLGMSIVGCLFAFLEAMLNRPGMNPLEFVVGATILLPLIFQESNFSLMAGNILLLYISFYIYFAVGLRVRLGNNSGDGK